MVKNKSAVELGKRGGSVSSEAKAIAARANAKKPRRKPMPELDSEALLRMCVLEMETEKKRCEIVGQPYGGLRVDGHDLIDVIKSHLGMK